jgi:hypothetical protein
VVAYTTVDELARVLRLRSPSASQGTAMQRVIDTAAGEINRFIGTSWASAADACWPDSPGTPDPLAAALVVEVNLERAVEHWQQQESPFGIIGLGEQVPTVTAKDTFERHANKLAPLQRSWGIA